MGEVMSKAIDASDFYDEFYCLNEEHNHIDRNAEALCSAHFQLKDYTRLRKALSNILYECRRSDVDILEIERIATRAVE